MFTIEQIKTAHQKTKTGADFPAYIRGIKVLGVTYYETYVADGHTDYFGNNNFRTSSAAKYDVQAISITADVRQFKSDLLAHQHGDTDYAKFCQDCAKAGVEKWGVCIEKLTCTYYDTAGNEILVERIPH